METCGDQAGRCSQPFNFRRELTNPDKDIEIVTRM
jgi:hypothetical protein